MNLVAALVIGAAAWGFWNHKKAMGEAWKRPVYQPDVKAVKGVNIRADAVGMQLGRFPRPKVDTGPKTPEKTEEQIESVLARLGTITSAITVDPPYDDGNKPAIIFRLKTPGADGTKIRILGLGEAIESRDHPEYGKLVQVPYRYQFIRCEPDPDIKGGVLFVFDMNCDGKDIQKTRWAGELDKDSKIVGEGTDGSKATPDIVRSGNKFIFGDLDKKRTTTPVTPQPETGPKPVVPPVVDQPRTLGSERDGRWTPTDEGRRYLENNYDKVLNDAKTQTYRDSSGRAAGVRITSIRRGSVANEFGIRPDDVIISINDKLVTKRARAIQIVKDDIKKGRNIITVKLLRNGREIIKQYDAKDPNVRRNARKLK